MGGEKETDRQIKIKSLCVYVGLRETVRECYLQALCLSPEALGAELHDGVGAEGVPDAELTDGQEPQGGVHLQLRGGDQDGLVP